MHPTRAQRPHRRRPAGPQRPTRLPRPLATIAGMAMIAVVASGCAAAGAGGGPTSTTANIRQQVTPIYRELAQCIREHGYPGFPDPVVKDDGTVDLPDEVGQELERHEASIRPHCEQIFNRLPASVRDRREGRPQLTPEQVAKLRQFAQCMRQHGMPNWPDPGADGSFPMTDEIEREGKSPRMRSAMEACERLNPDARGRVYFSSEPKGGNR